ncbi:MAG: hypothetical protein A2W31_10315 [Planctomycetes bacterium RBG_16_64_10]|nr:MAG: hypothetical protein A2W31_10315 [Planctomycetes bacterium RBG_16_64_10]
MIDHRAARRVDQVSGWLHPTQRGCVDQMPRLVRQRGVDRNVVRCSEQLLKADQRNAELGDPVRRQIGIAANSVQAETGELLAHTAPNAAQAYDPQGLAFESADGEQRREIPRARGARPFQRLPAPDHLAAAGQDQRDRVFGDVDLAVIGLISKLDAQPGAGTHVDIVVADPMPDKKLAPIKLGKDRFGHRHHVHHDHIGAPSPCDNLLRWAVLELISRELEPALPGQLLGLPVQIRFDEVGHDDSDAIVCHHFVLHPMRVILPTRTAKGNRPWCHAHRAVSGQRPPRARWQCRRLPVDSSRQRRYACGLDGRAGGDATRSGKSIRGQRSNGTGA